MSLQAIEGIKDLGTLKFGKVHQFEYDIVNTLDKDLVIDKVQVSCSSCTKATMDKKIKGKSTAKLKVAYTPGVVGETSKHISIKYDKDQTLVVYFKGVVNE